MSIIEQQKELEYYPDDVLAQEMMQPTGIAPSFLVATEIKRRNDMRNAHQAQMNPQPQTSVVEEEAMELGGIPNVDPNAMQQQMMQQPMPQQQMMQQPMPQNAPMQMQEGGTVEYGVDEGAVEAMTDDGSGFLSAGLGAVGLLREGGNIRYQSGQDIDPNLIAMGWTIDEEGRLIPISEQAGWQGPYGNTITGPEGWLFDTDLYTGGEDNPYAGRPGARAGNIALDLAKVKLAKTGLKGAKKTWDKTGGFKGMTKGIRDKYDEGIAGLRARLGGTRTGTTPEINLPIPPNVGGFPKGIPAPIKPTSITGRAADIALNNPATTAVLGGAGVASILPDAEIGTEVEATDIPLTSEEKVELKSLMTQAAYNADELFGEGGYSAFKKLDERVRLDTLRNALVAGKMPTEAPSFNTADASGGGIASSRSQVMDELNAMLGSGDQALRDQQGAALVQLGAGIAAGDLAGGLSAAGKEVSALKASRSGEKIKAIMALIEMEYKQGLLSANQAKSIMDQITLLQENSIGDPNAEAKIDQLHQQLNALLGGANNTGLQTAANFLG